MHNTVIKDEFTPHNQGVGQFDLQWSRQGIKLPDSLVLEHPFTRKNFSALNVGYHV